MEYVGIGILIVLGIYIAPILMQLLLITMVFMFTFVVELFKK